MINDERLQTDSCLKQQENQQVNINFLKYLNKNRDLFSSSFSLYVYIYEQQIRKK